MDLQEAMELLRRLEPYLTWRYARVAAELIIGALILRWFWRRWRLGSRLWELTYKLVGPHFHEWKRARAIRRAEKAEDWLEAGLLYEEQGAFDRALDCYERAGEYHLCGEICHRLGRKDYAAEWFILAGEKMRAAALFEELALFHRAGETYLDAGSTLDAAQSFLKAGELTRAGELYAEAGHHNHAGQAFERAGDFRRAGESFERQLLEVGGWASRFEMATERVELVRLCLRAAQCFEKIGELERAARILDDGGQSGLAASLLERMGDYRRAAQLYQKSGQVQKAAALYRMAGESHSAAALEGEHQLSSGNSEVAAESFLESGDPLRAAEIFESIGQFHRAADTYAALEAYPQAADAAMRANEKARAANFFEKAKCLEQAARLHAELGNFDRAASLFAATGRFFDAAKAADEANDEKLKVDYLQQVPSEDPHFHAAIAELARHFNRRGWSSLANERLDSVLAHETVRIDNLELWDAYAEAQEALGDSSRASEILHKMMAVQFNYRNIAERHQRLEERIREERIRESSVSGGRAAGAEIEGGVRERYSLEGMLGKGATGTVYRAYDKLLQRLVAYKVLSKALSRIARSRDRLLNEARAAAALSHPNIITIFDIGLEGGRPFIAMELIEGESCFHLARRQKRLEIKEVTHILVSVCQGLDHAHHRGIVHGDLKPSNILLSVDGQVKIVDFGLARPLPLDSYPTGSSYPSPARKYWSPEQAKGEATDRRSDIYSVGVTLFELLLGHPPFAEGDLILHHLYTPPPPMRRERPEIPPDLEYLVLHCLAKDPGERFQSAGEVISYVSAAHLL